MEERKATPKLREDLTGKSLEEALEILKTEGIELTDEQIRAISGGGSWTGSCPKCGSEDIKNLAYNYWACNSCGHTW